MPLREFDCPRCHHTTEELFKLSEDVPGQIDCERCGNPATFKAYSLSNVHCLGHHEAEAWNKTFFGAKERANEGFTGITCRKDVEAMEEHLGLGQRLEPGTAAYNRAIDHQQAEADEVARVEAEGGSDAVLRWDLKKSVQEETGWTDAEFNSWETETETAMQAIDEGAVLCP